MMLMKTTAGNKIQKFINKYKNVYMEFILSSGMYCIQTLNPIIELRTK